MLQDRDVAEVCEVSSSLFSQRKIVFSGTLKLFSTSRSEKYPNSSRKLTATSVSLQNITTIYEKRKRELMEGKDMHGVLVRNTDEMADKTKPCC